MSFFTSLKLLEVTIKDLLKLNTNRIVYTANILTGPRKHFLDKGFNFMLRARWVTAHLNPSNYLCLK
jgi:hypothetical protein